MIKINVRFVSFLLMILMLACNVFEGDTSGRVAMQPPPTWTPNPTFTPTLAPAVLLTEEETANTTENNSETSAENAFADEFEGESAEATETPTSLPVPVDEVAEPTPTPVPTEAEATATPEPTETPTSPPPTNTPAPAPPPPPPPTNTPVPPPPAQPSVGQYGISGKVVARDKTTFAVGEKAFFTYEANNHTENPVAFGKLGIKASNGHFNTSWINPDTIFPGVPFRHDDGLTFEVPGQYQVFLAICYAFCDGGDAVWEEYPGGAATITVQ